MCTFLETHYLLKVRHFGIILHVLMHLLNYSQATGQKYVVYLDHKLLIVEIVSLIIFIIFTVSDTVSCILKIFNKYLINWIVDQVQIMVFICIIVMLQQ